MGYGSRALNLLRDYYDGKMVSLSEPDAVPDKRKKKAASSRGDGDATGDLLTETIQPRKNLPPLLLELSERAPERLHYLGVSFGITQQLHRFWKRAGFVPVYLRQTTVRGTLRFADTLFFCRRG